MKKYPAKSGKFVRRRRSSHGFTLVEIMIVLFILVSIAGAGVLGWQSTLAQSRQKNAQLFIENMKTPLDLFSLNVGRYPTTEEGLGALLEPPATLADPSKWSGPYVKENISGYDPWGEPYQYESPGRRGSGDYDLWSSGPDRISDTDDDICSWK